MTIKVNNCLKCPFVVEDVDFNSMGKEVCISCNLLKFLRLEHIEQHRFRCFDYEEWTEMEYLKPLKDCPLKNIDKLEIQYG